jgi:asparagine synthase (glutamine-hydrolysing)
MSMAWSREIRVPFLDYRLVEKMMSLPDDVKLNQGWTKWIFRKAMEPYLPREIVWRKDKQGFVNPQSEWLKSDLKEQVMEYFLDPSSHIFAKSIVNQRNLLRNYDDFCKNRNSQVSYKDIFAPLSLEIWLRQFEAYIQ